MKRIVSKLIIGAAACLTVLSGCKRDLPQANLTAGSFGSAGLAATSTTLVLDSAGGGTKTAVTFNWPAINYVAKVSVTYTLQIDSASGTFAKPVTVTMAGGLSKTYTAGDFNTIALGLGLTPTVSGTLKVRVMADVKQSTGAASAVPTVISNVVSLAVTPYSTIPKPIYPVPGALFLVGDATGGGWNNPVPVPVQQFTQIDPNTFGIVVQLTGGKQFLMLPVNGDWSHKYAVTGTPDPAGGAFVPDAPNNMAGPVASGLYKIIVDFVKGTYTITAALPGDIPTNLYIVGDATAGGWNNPVPVPSQQFTQLSSGEFKITIALTTGKSYLWLPLNGDWTHKYGGASATGGAVLADSQVPNSNTPAPGASGTYTIDVNFFSKQYTVK
ncbi:MAG: SusE domain-containing protein [Bacteroidota bacterium]|nr:SusE domain-containing protein [Bacteroidota bacterium]